MQIYVDNIGCAHHHPKREFPGSILRLLPKQVGLIAI